MVEIKNVLKFVKYKALRGQIKFKKIFVEKHKTNMRKNHSVEKYLHYEKKRQRDRMKQLENQMKSYLNNLNFSKIYYKKKHLFMKLLKMKF